jgi:hypothetical protein
MAKYAPQAREVVSDLTTALKDDDWKVRMGVAQTLEQMGEDADPALKELVEGLGDFNNQTARSCMKALQKIGVRAVPLLIEALKSDDRRRKNRAAKTLGRIGPAARMAMPELQQLVEAGTPAVRMAARSALRRISQRAR